MRNQMWNVVRRMASVATLSCLGATMAQAQFGSNLITNSGAEAGSPGPTIPGWTTTGAFEVVSYTAGGGFPVASDPGPASRGSNFFGGGYGNVSSASQVIDLSGYAGLAAIIDGGAVGYDLSGYLGGFSTQSDYMTLAADFLSGGSTTLGSVTLGPVTEAERAGNTGLLFRMLNGVLPTGTRSIMLTMTATRFDGSYDDGYADELSLSLTQRAVTATPEPATLALLGGLLPVVGVIARRRARRS